MIRQTTKPSQWFYVQSKDNPADHASRGLSATELQDSTWFKGPAFLWQRHLEPETVKPKLQLRDPEVKSARCLHTEMDQSREHTNVLALFEQFSSWSKAVTVVARLQRLANGVKGLQATTVE